MDNYVFLTHLLGSIDGEHQPKVIDDGDGQNSTPQQPQLSSDLNDCHNQQHYEQLQQESIQDYNNSFMQTDGDFVDNSMLMANLNSPSMQYGYDVMWPTTMFINTDDQINNHNNHHHHPQSYYNAQAQPEYYYIPQSSMLNQYYGEHYHYAPVMMDHFETNTQCHNQQIITSDGQDDVQQNIPFVDEHHEDSSSCSSSSTTSNNIVNDHKHDLEKWSPQFKPPPPTQQKRRKKCEESQITGKNGATLVDEKTGERIRRPPNAFMIYAKDRRREILYGNRTMTNKEVSKQLGAEWRSMSYHCKMQYHRLALQLRTEHQIKYPGYVYSPAEARRRKLEKLRLKQQLNSETSFDNN